MINNTTSTTFQPSFNTTTMASMVSNILNETTTTVATTTAQTLPEYKLRRANFIWPEDPDDEIPVK